MIGTASDRLGGILQAIRILTAFLIPLALMMMMPMVQAAGGEAPLRIASGPFAVAGSPDAYSVAWVDDSGEFPALWLRVESGPRASRLHLVGGNVQREAGIFLEMNAKSVAVAWKGADGWNIGHLDRRGEPGAGIRSLPLPGSDQLLNISLREDEAGLVALLRDAAGGVSRLVEIDLHDGASRTLYQIHVPITASAIAAMADRIGMLWTDSEGGLVLEILDASGRISVSRRLNLFPVAVLNPRIGRYEGTMTAAWTERLPDGLAPRIARVSADGSFRVLDPGEPTPDGRAGRIVPSQGDGRLLVRERVGQPPVTGLMLLDGRSNPSCEQAMVDAQPSDGTWLLGGGESALLFRSMEIEGGLFSLTLQQVQCGIEASAGGAGTDSAGGTILGGSEDPCNGFDDDGDGVLDNGCDLVCDAPEVAIGPLDLVDEAWESSGPAVVRAGNEYGVAFMDSRSANAGIFFVRMDESGNIIYERRITAATYLARKPTLVWSGAQYGLAWEDLSTGRFEIYVSILNGDGSESTAPRQVTDSCPGCTGAGGLEPSIAWSGSEYGVAFYSTRNGSNEILFARLQSNGVKIGTDQFINPGGDSRTPSLVWAGTEWGVAWKESLTGGNNEIFFRLIDDLGNPYGAILRITNATGYSGEPSLVWTGAEYGLSWNDDRLDGREIYFARLRSTGQKLSSDIRITTSTGSAWFPALVWTGGEFIVSWNDTRGGGQHAYTARISSAGVKQGGDLRVSAPPANAGFTSLAWSGTGQVLVWEDNQDGVWGLHTALVRCCDDMDGDGYTECGDPNDQDAGSYPGGPDVCDGRDNNGNGVVDESCEGLCAGPDNRTGDLRVSDPGAGVVRPVIAWNGTEFGVAWNVWGSGVWFRRLDADGQPIGPPANVSAGGYAYALVWSGTEYGLLAGGTTASQLLRLDATGNLVGTTTLDGMSETAMVWNGSEYALVTDEFLFYRIDAAGNQLGQPVDLGITSIFPHVDLAWNGTGYGLVYRRSLPFFVRFDPAGALIGGEIALSSDFAVEPSIVWTGSGYGVAWDYGNSPGGIRFVRLDANGVVQGAETTVTSTTRSSQVPVVRWTGEEYGVAWQDDRSWWDEIYFQRLTAGGAPSGSALRWNPTGYEIDARVPAMVWNGTDYGVIARFDYLSSTPAEAWFLMIQCCGQNGDGDGYGKCDDCDDQNGAVYPFAPQICDGLNNDCDDPAWPLLDGTNETDLDGDTQSACGGDCDETDTTVYTGAPELCDFQDNDCDTVIDEGFPVPGTSDFVAFRADKEVMEWRVTEFADRYDVVRGDLARLQSSGGDFMSSTDMCVADDTEEPGARDTSVPTSGNGFHYLVRAEAACKTGTYDSEYPSQAGLRDEEIGMSKNSCP